MKFRSISLIAILLLLSGTLLAQDKQKEIKKNLEILDSIYCKIVGNYVEDVTPAKIMNTGVKAMLSSLDPFSVFYDQNETKEVKLALTAKYGGIGCVFAPTGNGIFVSRVREGYSGFRAGIRPGDTILSINNAPINGKSLDDVIDMVRGTPGTNITLGFRHLGQTQESSATLQREEIKLNAVPYHGMVGIDIGYISLARESKNSGEEVKQALTNLKEKHNLKGLILDLRNNEGGMVSEANKILGLFLDKGDTTVLERSVSSDANSVSVSQDLPIDKNTPMIILTNKNTISAGEIITGAIQDHDRGVVVGERTFGKGLVQRVYDLPFQTLLTLTVDYYYTPSGRCIESAQYSGTRSATAGISEQDSSKKRYKTRDGRTVYSFGGIAPDILFPSIGPAPVTVKLIQEDWLYQYAIQYRVTHPAIPGPQDFHLSEIDFDQFKEYLQKKNFAYQTETEKRVKQLKELAIAEGQSDEITATIQQLQSQLAQSKSRDLEKNKEDIRSRLEAEIVSVYYFETGRNKYLVQNDPEIKKAAEILNNRQEYEKILTPQH